jgi:hypothetical protein
MNAYQKATLLPSTMALPLLLLFMQGMDYRGTPLVGAVGMGTTAALIYALRMTRTEPK